MHGSRPGPGANGFFFSLSDTRARVRLQRDRADPRRLKLPAFGIAVCYRPFHDLDQGSVLPRASLSGAWQDLGKLGNKPLGTALFANPKIKRTPLEYKKLSRNHTLYQRATQHLINKPSYLWARRSVFSLNCATILVTEVFLPQLLST